MMEISLPYDVDPDTFNVEVLYECRFREEWPRYSLEVANGWLQTCATTAVRSERTSSKIFALEKCNQSLLTLLQ